MIQLRKAEVYTEPSQISNMKLFEKIINDLQSLTILPKNSTFGRILNTSLQVMRVTSLNDCVH